MLESMFLKAKHTHLNEQTGCNYFDFSQCLFLFNRLEISINIYRFNSKHLPEVRESPE